MHRRYAALLCSALKASPRAPWPSPAHSAMLWPVWLWRTWAPDASASKFLRTPRLPLLPTAYSEWSCSKARTRQQRLIWFLGTRLHDSMSKRLRFSSSLFNVQHFICLKQQQATVEKCPTACLARTTRRPFWSYIRSHSWWAPRRHIPRVALRRTCMMRAEGCEEQRGGTPHKYWICTMPGAEYL